MAFFDNDEGSPNVNDLLPRRPEGRPLGSRGGQVRRRGVPSNPSLGGFAKASQSPLGGMLGGIGGLFGRRARPALPQPPPTFEGPQLGAQVGAPTPMPQPGGPLDTRHPDFASQIPGLPAPPPSFAGGITTSKGPEPINISQGPPVGGPMIQPIQPQQAPVSPMTPNPISPLQGKRFDDEEELRFMRGGME